MKKSVALSVLRFKWIALVFLFSACAEAPQSPKYVNDVTQLNQIEVDRIITPTTEHQIVAAIKAHEGPISIGGGRFSMGGQTATENALQIDMRNFNEIIGFSKQRKEITVQSGIRWRELIAFIDRYDLSVKIMQTYANFTVGGSLSVNAHGRYVGQGPIILSVKSIKIVLANGSVMKASPVQNSAIFYGAIGGYGGIGVITEVTLSLTENCRVERFTKMMDIEAYSKYFKDSIKNRHDIIFHNADIFSNDYKRVRAISYIKTTKPVTVPHRLKPEDQNYFIERSAVKVVADYPFGKWLRRSVDPIFYKDSVVEWRNYEATYDVKELEPRSRKKSTYVLQEYFVPIDKFDAFYPKMSSILKKYHVNVMNVSIRHANQDPGSTMAWARTEVFAFVIYYKQGVKLTDQVKVEKWTCELIDSAIAEEGTYYLPYQIHATSAQFRKAYPGFDKFFALKKKYDPTYKFRNKLFDAYYIN